MASQLRRQEVSAYIRKLKYKPGRKPDTEPYFQQLLEAQKTARNPPRKRKSSQKHQKRKRARTIQSHRVPRCTSPSHFNCPKDELESFGPPHDKQTPFKRQLDGVLRAVSEMFYRRRPVEQQSKYVIYNEYPDAYKSLELIKSPIRKPNVLENWTLREIALFECGICEQGKDFYQIAKIIQTKTTKDCVEFYYHWKRSSHYHMFKAHGRPG